jgi:alanyl-tRNA synthetase
LPDVIEIWNNVFIQYNREADGSLRQLPAQHVDTGMGFERLTSILQGVDSNYDTDIFMPLFAAIQAATNARPYAGQVGPIDDPQFIDMAYRVVADHIRTLCFAIADGAVPSNDGRGYVLRRVLRRAVRFGRQNLGAELGFFSKLVPALIELMGKTFPELVEKQDHVTAVIMDEEESFSRTLDKGLAKFNELAQNVGADKVFSGEDAHFLYTSMGFPVDLTELMAQERAMTVDKEGFERRMKEEQELSAAAHMAKIAGGSGKDMRLVAEQMARLVIDNVPATDDSAKYVWNQDLEGCTVKALFIGRNETEDNIGFVDSISLESSTVGVIMDMTSYYAEQGGQIFDTGTIVTSFGATVRVDNVQLYGQFAMHLGEVVSGILSVGDKVSCKVDYIRRAPIASNHTMTHVLNHALKEILIVQPERETGKVGSMTVDQKGSLVDEHKLRFDYSWNSGLSPEQLAAVEKLCVERIEKAIPVSAYVAPLSEAEKISSLRAVFGEKYPDPVRVVSVSDHPVTDMLSNPQDALWNEYSVEFCGGTHLTNTSEAQAFVLLSEEGIAKGIRRIVAITMGDAKMAIAKADEFEGKLKSASALEEETVEASVKVLTVELNSLGISASKKIEFRETLSAFSKQVAAYRKQKVAGMADEIVDKAVAAAQAAEGKNMVVLRFDLAVDGKVAKSVTTAYCKKVQDTAVMLVCGDAEADKIMVVVAAPKGVDVDCKAWASVATEEVGGKGGGKQDNAIFNVAGYSNMETVLAKARQYE